MRIPRPLGTAIHGTRPNQVPHFDYIYIHPVPRSHSHNYAWVLIIRDDFSGLTHLCPAETPDSHVTSEALLRWRSFFGTPELYVSDQAAYFVGQVMQSLTFRLGIEQHGCTTYIHYPNGTVEVIGKLVFQAFRTMISELRWLKNDWTFLLPTIEYYLNHKPQTRLDGRAPITVMTGIERDNPLDLIFRIDRGLISPTTKLPMERVEDILSEAAEQLNAL